MQETMSESPPPLPPNESPPPLPPPEDSFGQHTQHAQQTTWATQGPSDWASGNSQSLHGWHKVDPHNESHNFQGYSKVSAQEASASSHGIEETVPLPPPLPGSEASLPDEGTQPPPPPAPPSPSGPAPWQDQQSNAFPAGPQLDPSQQNPNPANESAPWLNYQAQGSGQAVAADGQQWQSQWYQGYENYPQAYSQYEGYAAYSEQQYQQPGSGPGHGYEGQDAYANQQLYPWSQTPAAASQPLVSTKNEVDAVEIFKPPGRYQRPAKIAIIMRGLPGSGKTYIAKRLREIEVEQGGEAPRIHALDDYFVTEVEKEVTDEQPGKRPKKRVVTVMEYLYEQDLEDSYRASILKAFTKTVEEGRFPFVILDAPNIQVEDFRPFYMAAQRVGYAVFVLKPLESNPEVCFSQNIHQRDQDTISDLAAMYEPTPNLFTQIMVESLFDLPKKEEAGEEESIEAIEEVDMEDDARDVDEDPDQPQIKSRWASLDEEPEEEEEAPRKKRKRKPEEEEAPKEEGAADQSENGKVARRNRATSILKQAGGKPSHKVLRWADEVDPVEGFSIGGPAAQQLEEVHYLEGLGPSPEGQHTNLSHQSFMELARKERTTEKHSFRDLLLGKRGL